MGVVDSALLPLIPPSTAEGLIDQGNSKIGALKQQLGDARVQAL